MIKVISGKLVSLSPAGGLSKSQYRSYPYAEFVADNGQVIRVADFKAWDDVDRDLKEDASGVFIFTKVAGHTNLAAVKTSTSERVTTPDHEFGVTWKQFWFVLGVLSFLVITWILIPVILLIYLPAAIAVSRERALLHAELTRFGFQRRPAPIRF